MRLISLSIVLATLALPACAQVREGQAFPYRCAGGAALQVAYVNAADGASYAVVEHDGTLSVLKAGPTGSGVRYVSVDGSSLVWHVKGPEGFLAHDNANETTIASECKQQ